MKCFSKEISASSAKTFDFEKLFVQKSTRSSFDRALVYMIDNFAEEIDLDDVANASMITKFNLCRLFQRKFGISPMRWLWSFRSMIAAEFIALAPTWSLTDIAFTCGFSSSAHFCRSFSALHGVSPSSFRKRAKINREHEGVASNRPSSLAEFGAIYENNARLLQSAFVKMLGRNFSLVMPRLQNSRQGLQ